MDLIFDIGNSNIVISWVKNNVWIPPKRVKTNRKLPEVYYRNLLSILSLEHGLNFGEIEKVVISSVVTEVTDLVATAIQYYYGKDPIILDGKLFSNLDMSVKRPYEIGSDLVSNAYCVFKEYEGDHIIVDFGTALTFTILKANEGIQGVTIAPGLKTSINALSRGTSKLPEVPLELPGSVVGHNTTHAIQAGVLYGYIGLVKEILSRIKTELGSHYKVVATGGLREVLKELREEFDEVDELLTLKGIQLLGRES